MKTKFNSLNINDTLLSVERVNESKFESKILMVALNPHDRFKSPFTSHFNKILKKYGSVSCERNVLNNQNFFFAPELYEIFIDFLRFAPLWTNILVCDKDQDDGDLSDDNPIEKWFNNINTKGTKFCPLNYANKTLEFVESLV